MFSNILVSEIFKNTKKAKKKFNGSVKTTPPSPHPSSNHNRDGIQRTPATFSFIFGRTPVFTLAALHPSAPRRTPIDSLPRSSFILRPRALVCFHQRWLSFGRSQPPKVIGDRGSLPASRTRRSTESASKLLNFFLRAFVDLQLMLLLALLLPLLW